MSKYTTEVRFICENVAGLTNSAGYSRVDDIISKAIPMVFDFDFPIFDESYRNVLCKKILKHYYTREICEETVGLWKLRLDTRMNEVMPYFNKLYKSELLDFNPLYDVDIKRTTSKESASNGNDTVTSTKTVTGQTETDTTNKNTSSSITNQLSEGTNNGSIERTNESSSENTASGTNNSTTTGSNESETTGSTVKDTSVTNTGETESNETVDRTERDLYSDTPQGALNNVEDEDYLTNARKKLADVTKNDTTTSSDTSNSKVTGSDSSSTTGSSSTSTTGADSRTSSGTETSTTTGTNTNSSTGKIDTTNRGEDNQVGNTTSNFNNTDSYNRDLVKNAESTEDYLESVAGKRGGTSYSKMLMEYRSTFINIDMQVIESLSDLFFGLW